MDSNSVAPQSILHDFFDVMRSVTAAPGTAASDNTSIVPNFDHRIGLQSENAHGKHRAHIKMKTVAVARQPCRNEIQTNGTKER